MKKIIVKGAQGIVDVYAFFFDDKELDEITKRIKKVVKETLGMEIGDAQLYLLRNAPDEVLIIILNQKVVLAFNNVGKTLVGIKRVMNQFSLGSLEKEGDQK